MRVSTNQFASWLVWIVGGFFAVAGCADHREATEFAAREPISTTDQVCKIAADLFGIDRSKVGAETSLADLGADEIAFTELVVELEEHFDVDIPDNQETDWWQNGPKDVTMGNLASVVDHRKQFGGRRSSRATGDRRSAEVRTDAGMHTANHDAQAPQVKVYLNPLALLLAGAERKKGRHLTREEVLEIRDNAKFVMMSREQADKHYAALDANIDIYRINPDRAWEEWTQIRDQVEW